MVFLFYWVLIDIFNVYELFVNNKFFDFEKIFKSVNFKVGIESLNKFFYLWFDFYNLRKL